MTKSGTLYYPLWLSHAASLAMDEPGAEVLLIDAPAADMEKDAVLARIREFKPTLAVVETSTPSIYNDTAFCAEIKGVATGCFTLIVGTHVSALPEESLALNDAVDAVAVGEFDMTALELARAIEKGTDAIKDVAGLCLRSGKTAPRGPIEDLDTLPFVSRAYKKFLDPRHYFNPNALFPMVTITTSRGCPHHCTFCVYPQTMMGHRMRLRSVRHVVDEVAYIKENFPEAKAIFFEDDTFTAIGKRCREISQAIIDRGIRISWTANARADLDLETMKLMKAAGCRSMCVGFESGSQELLDGIKKRIRIDRMAEFMANARAAGILIHGCFMVGLPGETRATAESTLNLAKRLSPDTIQFYPIMVYPGTEAYDWYKSHGLITASDWSKWLTPGGLHNTVVRTEQMSPEEMVAFCDRARREFYLRPKYILYKLKQTLMNPDERRRNLKSARTFIKYLIKGSDVSKGSGCGC